MQVSSEGSKTSTTSRCSVAAKILFLVKNAGGNSQENEAANGMKTKWILDKVEERACSFGKGKHAHPGKIRLQSRMNYLSAVKAWKAQ